MSATDGEVSAYEDGLAIGYQKGQLALLASTKKRVAEALDVIEAFAHAISITERRDDHHAAELAGGITATNLARTAVRNAFTDLGYPHLTTERIVP